MGITIYGNIIVKGDQIFDGGIKIVKGYKEEEMKEPLTEEKLKEDVDFIIKRLENGRLWFPVCKYMMWRGLCAEGNFTAAVEILSRLYPHIALNAKDLTSLNVLSFRKSLAEWDLKDSPIKDFKTFNKYKDIASILMSL